MSVKSDTLAAAEDLQAFVNRLNYVRPYMAAGEQAAFDVLTRYPCVSERHAPAPEPCGRFDASGKLKCEESAEHQGPHRAGAIRWAEVVADRPAEQPTEAG